MDYEVLLEEDLLSVKGSLIFSGEQALPYLLLNASLLRDNELFVSARYLLLEVDPLRDYGFEICKNAPIPVGDYECLLSVEATQGQIFEERRRVSLKAGAVQARSSGTWNPEEEDLFWLGVRQSSGDSGNSGSGPSDRKSASAASEKGSSSGKASSEAASSGAVVSGISGSDVSGSGGLLSGGAVSGDLGSAQNEAEALKDRSSGASSVVGSLTTKRYHRPDCRYAGKIKPENLVRFESSEEAEREGYLPCKSCTP